jgi:hypothetical protein
MDLVSSEVYPISPLLQTHRIPVPDGGVDEAYLKAVAENFAKNGEHPDYREFARCTVLHTNRDAFTFIRDACEGTGGFVDGTYLDPHKRELQSQTQSGAIVLAANQVTNKFIQRVRLADYDNFPRMIESAYWSYIIQSRDLIRRDVSEKARPGVREALGSFWANCDGHRATIADYLAQPVKGARRYGTGWTCIDKDSIAPATAAEESREGGGPYVYVVPTENILYWEFDDDMDDLTLVIIAMPESGHSIQDAPIRIWTPTMWATFDFVANPNKPKKQNKNGGRAALGTFVMRESGVNALGEIPLVPLYNRNPGRGKALAETEMREVCLLAKSVYNIDSEKREIQRNTAFAFLSLPVKSISSTDTKKIAIGTDSLLLYDGNSGEPRWVTPDLTALDKLEASKAEKKETAYSLAELASTMGHIQTSSGYQSEVEFDKTNRRIGQFASACEEAENKMARLVLRYQFADLTEQEIADSFTIVYPREFNVRDLERMIARTIQLLALNAGDEANVQIFTDLFSVVWPRKPKDEIKRLAEAAGKSFVGLAPQASGPGVPGSNIPATPGVAAAGKTQDAAQQAIETKIRRLVGDAIPTKDFQAVS